MIDWTQTPRITAVIRTFTIAAAVVLVLPEKKQADK